MNVPTSSDNHKNFQDRTAAGISASNPAKKAGRSTATTATSGATTQRAGLMLRTSARRREDTWPLLPPVPPKNTWNRGIGRVLEAALMFGWEATTLRRRLLGSG